LAYGIVKGRQSFRFLLRRLPLQDLVDAQTRIIIDVRGQCKVTSRISNRKSGIKGERLNVQQEGRETKVARGRGR
jgi:hypothetical protein